MEILKQKLSSRKLWAAIAAAALCIVSAICGDAMTADAVQLIQYAVNALVAYIFGETAVDIFRQIAEAVKEKYAIPSVEEILAGIDSAENGESGEGASEADAAEADSASADPPAEG